MQHIQPNNQLQYNVRESVINYTLSNLKQDLN